MSERHPSKPGRKTQSLDAPAAQPGPRLSWALAALFLLSFSVQSVIPQGSGGQFLALAWPRSLFEGHLWQFLTYPLTLPDLSRLPRGVVGLCLIEYVSSLSIVLLMGAQLERRLGAARLAQALLFIVLGSALIAVPALMLRPRMGELLAGPMDRVKPTGNRTLVGPG
jgi:membrane associated rhomboid family serine protease